jgi:hypothetical protein
LLLLLLLLQEVDTGEAAEDVAAAIKQRKAQLAPAIQELRNLRQQQQVRLAGSRHVVSGCL